MKKLLIILSFLLIGMVCQAQISTKHFFGTITINDVKVINELKIAKLSNFTFAWFLRGKIAETAWEIPLFHGGGSQFFSATGVGLSLAAYGLDAVEKFSVDAIIYTPTNNNILNGISTSLAIGIPVPKLNLPINLNIGIREDWKAKVTYLQTNITLEF